MQIARVLQENRKLLALGLLGLLLFAVGCDSGGGTPAVPAGPTKPGDAEQNARKDAYPTGKAARTAGQPKTN